MSKSRRSLVRSTLRHIRQLWQRRQEARREVKRCLGSTFEMLEPRLALTISSPLPSATDHIHPVLQIYLEGQQVTLPSGIGSTTSGNLNPHTHDLTGSLHIGEGGPAGIGTTVRNVTLQDFFDVWRTAGGPSGNNANAIFDTDLTDGTNLPRIMDKTVNASTHILRVYVKETADAAPELEYASNQGTNNLARPELYVPRDGDQVIISFDKIAQATDSPSFQPIANQTVLGGAPTWLGIDGFDPTGGPLTYTVQVSNPSLLTATLQPSTNKSMVINVADYGQMTFQLFNNLAPSTVQHFETIINNGEYNNSTTTPIKFYRIAHLGDGSDFVIQGGRNGVASSLGRFNDEFSTELQFTTAGLLAMAKSTDDTNDAEIFITGGPARFLDMQHTIFGVLTDGNEVRNAIQQSRLTGDGPPPTDIVITSTQIVTDNQNAALQLKAAEGASGTSTVTLTVSDGTRTFSQTFNVTVTPDTANSAPFLNPIAPITGVQGQPINVQLTAQDAENNPFFFDATKPASETVAYTVSTNNSTGLVTITPPANFVGTFNVSMGVRQVTSIPTTTADPFDTQLVAVTVTSSAPTVDLVSTSDSGASNTDNITNATTLDFLVSGVTSGATVRLLKGATVLATGVVPTGATTINLTVPNPGTNLGQGASAITATQTVGTQTSPASAALNVTFDSAAPTFSSTSPTANPVGFDLAYNAQTNEEGSGVVYSLTTPPTGATINSTTGLVTWTPTTTQAQTNTHNFSVVATDAAGNTATQALAVAVAVAKVDFTMTLTRPDGTALTTLSTGQDFVLHVFAADLRTPSRGVFAAYTDITFDSTKATITGPIVYSSTYASGRSGSTATAGLVDEVGAFAGTTELGAGAKEVFSIPMRATGSGSLSFSLDPADSSPTNDVLVYTQNGSVLDSEIHYSTISATVATTFTAVNDAFNANEDTQNNTLNPLANDASVGGATNTLTISAVGATSNGGTVTRTENNTRLSYTPAANFKGNETFTYTARNQNGEEQVATVTMTVADVNDPPVAVNDTFDASRNSTGNVLNVLLNDTSGVDTGETLRVTAVGTGSRGGTITIGTNGANITYAPANNVTGVETFTYTISDRATGGLTATATVTMNISGLTAAPDTLTVNEDSAATTINVLANDLADPAVPNSVLTITQLGTTDKGGTVAITQTNTRVSYTPLANFQGTETFTYTISDGQGHTATSTVTVTVTNVNDAPVATVDTFTAFRNTTASFDVLANDTSGPDPTENLIIESVTQPANGTVTITDAGKKVSYAPATGFSGANSFTYTIRDPGGLTSTATANITVQDFAPSALSGFVYFDVNNNGVKDAGESPLTGVTITLLTGSGTSATVNQTVKTSDDGSYKFENLSPGTFTIEQTDPLFTIDGRDTVGSQGGTASRTAINGNTRDRMVINVVSATTGSNNNFGELGRAAATISLRDFFSSTSRNYAYAAFDSAGNALWHSMNGSVWQSQTANTFSLVNNKTQIQLQGTNGLSQVVSRTVSAGSLPVYQPGSSGGNALYYIPGNSSTISTPINQSPTGVADTFSTPLNTALTVTAANGVLKNDTDPENNTLTASVVTQPANGTLSLNANGAFTFTPTTGFTGATTFTYRANDGNSNSAATTVTINVGTNTAPTGVADAFPATEDTVLSVTAANGLLKNDTDPESNPLTAVVNTQPTKGTLSLAADGSFTFTPTANANGSDTFTYRASDGTNQSAITTVTITIAAVNDPPTAVNDTFNATRNTTLTQAAPGVLVNDTDVDNTTLTVNVTPISAPANGTLTLSANGSFTYTPNTDFTGTDTFTYRVSDGTATTDGVATITVNPPQNVAPVAVNDTRSTNEDTALTVALANSVLVNDTDANGDTLTAVLGTTTSNGTLSLSSNGTFTYTPAANFNGSDFFTYRAKDSVLESTLATVTINVTSVNDTPVGVADSYRTSPDTALTAQIGTGVLANDTDGDGQTQSLTATVVSQPTSGTLSLATNGSFTYTPASGFVGTATFTYKATDTTGLESAPTTVTIVMNAAPTAANDTYTATEETQLVVALANRVLLNDSDPNSDPLTAVLVQTTSNGTLVFNADGRFTYSPQANFSGTDTFRYQASDGLATSGIATVTITVNAVNDVPTRTAGTTTAINVAEDSANTTAVTLGLTPLAYGPGGGTVEAAQTLTFKITAIPAFVNVFQADGTTAVAANETLTLTQLQGLTYKTVANAAGTGNLNWTIQDNGGTANGGIDTLTETLAITVGAVNDAPTRTAGSPAAINVAEDSANTTAVTLGLTPLTYGPGGGTDEASQTLTFRITAIPAFVNVFQSNGTTAVAANDTLTLAQLQGLTYKTLANANGTGNLTWTVQDSGGTASGGIDSLTETLAVTVSSINDAPARTAGAPAAINVAEDSANTTAVTLGLTPLTYGPGGGTVEAGQTLTFRITAIPAFVNVFQSNGTTAVAANEALTLAQLQGLTYKTVANAVGTGNLTWTVQDDGGTANGGVDTLTETLALTVNGINDAPARTAGSPAAINVSEDSANTTAVTLGLTPLTYGPGGGADEASQTLTFRITAIPAFVNVLQADGTTAVAANEALTLAQLQSLTYKTVANANGTGNLSWTIQDNGGTANGGIDTLTETLAITVGAVNDAPARTAGSPAAISVAEDSANTTAVTLGLTPLTYGPGGGTDEATQTLTFRITNIPAFVNVFQSNGTTAVAANEALTLAQLQSLTYKTVANANGTGNLTWTVQDSGGTANGGIDTLSEALAITVTAVNDAPARTAGTPADITVDEDSANTTAVTLGLTELTYGPGGGTDEAASPNQTLTFTITAIPAFVEVFKADGTTEVAANDTLTLTELQNLTYKTLADANGTGNLTWSVQDDGGTANAGVDTLFETLVITVTPVEGEGEGEGEAEGEGASLSAPDAALLAYFDSFDDFSTVGDTTCELSADDWEEAVDQAMAELS
jgi:large repetitive protein